MQDFMTRTILSRYGSVKKLSSLLSSFTYRLDLFLLLLLSYFG